MKITFWGTSIDAVESGKSYRITNALSRSFNGEIMLTTNSSSNITPIPAIPDVNDDLMAHFQDETTAVVVEQTRVMQTLKCSSCMKAISVENSTDLTTRCSNCSMKQKVSNLKKATTAFMNVNVCATNQKKKFVVFEEILLKFIEQKNVPNLINDTDRLEDFLLMQDTLSLKHAANSEIVKAMSTQEEVVSEELNISTVRE